MSAATMAFGDFDADALIAKLATSDGLEPGHWPRQSGLYAAYILEPLILGEPSVGLEGLLYIGQAKDLSERDHLTHRHSGSSTLRRSIGALFRTAWGAEVFRRAPGKCNSNCRNFRFDDATELRLTEWIRTNLVFRCVECPVEQLRIVEKFAILSLKPPLNLNIWPNPQRGNLKKLRGECISIARRQGI